MPLFRACWQTFVWKIWCRIQRVFSTRSCLLGLFRVEMYLNGSFFQKHAAFVMVPCPAKYAPKTPKTAQFHKGPPEIALFSRWRGLQSKCGSKHKMRLQIGLIACELHSLWCLVVSNRFVFGGATFFLETAPVLGPPGFPQDRAPNLEYALVAFRWFARCPGWQRFFLTTTLAVFSWVSGGKTGSITLDFHFFTQINGFRLRVRVSHAGGTASRFWMSSGSAEIA